MKNTDTIKSIEHQIQTIRDVLSSPENDGDYRALCVRRALREKIATDSLRAINSARACGHGFGDAKPAAGPLINQLVEQIGKELPPLIALAAALDCPEMDDAEARLVPIENDISALETKLADTIAEAGAKRNALEAKLAAARAKAENDPEVVALQEEIDRLNS